MIDLRTLLPEGPAAAPAGHSTGERQILRGILERLKWHLKPYLDLELGIAPAETCSGVEIILSMAGAECVVTLPERLALALVRPLVKRSRLDEHALVVLGFLAAEALAAERVRHEIFLTDIRESFVERVPAFGVTVSAGSAHMCAGVVLDAALRKRLRWYGRLVQPESSCRLDSVPARVTPLLPLPWKSLMRLLCGESIPLDSEIEGELRCGQAFSARTTFVISEAP